MPTIKVTDSQGGVAELDAKPGLTVMEVCADNNVAGMVAECGGACACATCHVYVAEDWVSRLPAMDGMEDAMLDAAMDRRANSRLSCQLEVGPELDGLELTVADNEA